MSYLLIKNSCITEDVNWIINEDIEPFNFSTELFDVFPVVEQHFYGVNDSLHGVEAV